MLRARIDISQGLDGEPLVLACIDLSPNQILASAYAVAAVAADRYRTTTMSADDVLEFRELTALADELRALSLQPDMATVVLPPARLAAYRMTVASFLESRDEAEWIRHEDRGHMAHLRELLHPLEDICLEAMRAALSPPLQRQV